MIPDWNSSAVLPPIRPGKEGHDADRSPYRVTLMDVVLRFATSIQRIEILRGLISYRAALRSRGVTSGFQWLDGSFMEHKEIIMGCAPKDIDVVTFLVLPPATTEDDFVTENSDLLNPEETKELFKVDAYGFVLGGELDQSNVRQVSYWYSMWSHRRNQMWKGFIEVDLVDDEDEPSLEILKQIERDGA